jgi:long-chain fatty acid transport protein
MKRLVVFLCVSALVFAVAIPLMAGGIENKHNYSAEYIRTLNRNAATDSADAVVYNPAGVVKMADGFYVNLSGQYVFKDYSNTVGGTEFDQDKPDIAPSLFALFTKDQWAAYAAFNIVCGGGTVEYDDGNATTLEIGTGTVDSLNFVAPSAGLPADNNLTSHSLDGESFHFAFTLGGAYQFNDWLSASLGVRYVDARREFEGAGTISGTLAAAQGISAFEVEFEDTADGWGGIIGANITPAEKWNIGIRYETEVNLELETDVDVDDLGIITDGAEADRDLPALLALGVSHQCTPNLKTDVNFTYYFNEDAEWDDNPLTSRDEGAGANGYDIGIALEYAFMPQLKGSVGYMYTYVGDRGAEQSFEEPKLDAHTIAAGVAYEAMPGLNLNFGILKTFYQDETTDPTDVFLNGVELEKDVIIVALGVQYKFW